MNKKISVITINYNDKVGLEKTINSVVSQTSDNFEYIIIDGGSNDGSKEVIEKYKDKIDYWISEPDKGPYNAMNKGIKAANGEFVIFMNGGDFFYDETVLETVDGLLGEEYDIYYGDNYKIKPNSKRKKTYPEELSFSFFYTSCINHQSTFIRRKLFFDHFFYNEEFKIVADWEFFVYTICNENVPYKYLGVTIANYDFTGISSVSKYRDIAHKEKLEVFNKYFPLFLEDYKKVAEIKSKRIQQVLYIKKFRHPWKAFKGIINFLAIFSVKNRL